jgi:catalase (peroxidase I)
MSTLAMKKWILFKEISKYPERPSPFWRRYVCQSLVQINARFGSKKMGIRSWCSEEDLIWQDPIPAADYNLQILKIWKPLTEQRLIKKHLINTAWDSAHLRFWFQRWCKW